MEMKCEKCNKQLSISDYSTLDRDNKRICMEIQLHEIPISEAMTKDLIMANKNSIITYCAKTMAENNVSSLIIVNEDDSKNDNYSLAGIVTTTDFTNFFSENCIGLTSVDKYMSIKENVSAAAQIMLEKKVSRLVVIDEDDNQNNLVGIIS
jgi:CBS domain-containing protein